MNINLNLPAKLFERLLVSVERLADDYATVHRDTLAQARTTDTRGGRTFYQDDHAIYLEEEKARAERLAREDF